MLHACVNRHMDEKNDAFPFGAGGMTIAAGTTSVAPINLAAGTNLTTATAGAHEYDGSVFYQTPVASNRGATSNYHFERLTFELHARQLQRRPEGTQRNDERGDHASRRRPATGSNSNT